MTSSFLIVPSTVQDAPKRRGQRKSLSNVLSMAAHDESNVAMQRNYMVKGGARAYEHQIETMNKARSNELRTANDALATELIRSKLSSESELASARSHLLQLQGELRIEKELREAMKKDLDDIQRHKQDADLQTIARIKDIQKRFKVEHEGRISAETELAGLRENRAGIELRLSELDMERIRLQAAVTEAVGQRGRLEAQAAADAATIAELRGRASLAEGSLQGAQMEKLNALTVLATTEIQFKAMLEKTNDAVSTASLAKEELQMSKMRVLELEEDGRALRQSLVNEKESSSALRKELSSLQKDLTELSTASTISSAKALEDRSALERLRREIETSNRREEAAEAEIVTVRESILHLHSKLVGLQEAHEASLNKEIKLQDELSKLRESSKIEIEQLQSQGASLQQQLLLSRAEEKRLSGELETIASQAENEQVARVFKERESLAQKLAQAEEAINLKDAMLAEALTSNTVQLELWRAEAAEVASACGKWKQRAILCERQMDSVKKDLSTTQEALSQASDRSSTDSAVVARLKEQLYLSEQKATSSTSDSKFLARQLQDTINSHQKQSQQLESLMADNENILRQRDEFRLKANEETHKASALRSKLAELNEEHVREQDSKSRLISELTVSLKREERSKEEAKKDADSLRQHLAILEKELRIAKTAVTSLAAETVRGSASFNEASHSLTRADQTLRSMNPPFRRERDEELDRDDEMSGEQALERLERLLSSGLA